MLNKPGPKSPIPLKDSLCKNNLSIGAFNTTESKTTIKRVGTALIISTIRIIILSSIPPKYPEIEP